ncbi:hypothetical protein HUJ04_010486 [Dendroctonus ponderosae]
MISKVFTIFCVAVYATKALPQYSYTSTDPIQQKLQTLGLVISDTFDYNSFILNLEAIVEESQQVALLAIKVSVSLAQQFAKGLDIYGGYQNIQQINNIQSNHFRNLESMRHEAFTQSIDISSCVYSAIHQIHTQSQSSIEEIDNKLDSINEVFENYTTVHFVEPSKTSLAMTYTIRERIYQCPFNFTDFSPFYLCLTTAAVLNDIVMLNEFATIYNDTTSKVKALITEFESAVLFWQAKNVEEFKTTAHI